MITMELTREKALELHRQMWSDMQKELGDNPSRGERGDYKRNWIAEHFPELETDDYDIIHNNCFLCEYADSEYGYCECLIDWPAGRCEDGNDTCDERNWQYMPISELLALPESCEDESEEEEESEEEKTADGLYRCDLCYSAEDECTGYMYLTREQYQLVKIVANTANWSCVDDGGYSGRLSIYCKKLEEK